MANGLVHGIRCPSGPPDCAAAAAAVLAASPLPAWAGQSTGSDAPKWAGPTLASTARDAGECSTNIDGDYVVAICNREGRVHFKTDCRLASDKWSEWFTAPGCFRFRHGCSTGAWSSEGFYA